MTIHPLDPLERVRHTLLQARCAGSFLIRRECEEIRIDLKWQSYGNEILAALEGGGLVYRRTGEQGVLMISGGNPNA